MAFNFFKWILKKTTPATDGVEVSTGDFLDNSESITVGLELYLQRMAFWACVRKIGSAVGAVEWETYSRGKSKKAREYWAWNYAPNPNQTKQEFFTRLVAELLSRNEALVVDYHGYRYVAEAFSTEKSLDGNIYRDVSVDGISVPGVFSSRDVLHFTLDGDNVRRILLAISSAEGQLMKSSASAYVRNKGMRGVLEIDDLAEADPDFDDTYNDLINNKFKKYFTAENAVLPLFKGYKFTTATNGDSKSASSTTTRDFRALMDDIIDLTAQTIGIPTAIVTGKGVTSADFNAFMTYTVQPLVRTIATEINRKLYDSGLVLKGTYIVPNLAGVKYTDLFDVADPIDKLISSGALCVNDIRLRLGLDIIDEPWAWQHYMTKNYSTVEDLNRSVGGDSSGDTGGEPSAGSGGDSNEGNNDPPDGDPDGEEGGNDEGDEE